MSVPAILDPAASSLPQLVDHAAAALTNARTAAEVLEAKDLAAFAYDSAKRAARLAKAKGAHDELIAAFARRDGAWAEAIMTGHILRAYHAYCDAHRQLTKAAEADTAA